MRMALLRLELCWTNGLLLRLRFLGMTHFQKVSHAAQRKNPNGILPCHATLKRPGFAGDRTPFEFSMSVFDSFQIGKRSIASITFFRDRSYWSLSNGE